MRTQRIAERQRDGRLWCLGLKIQADNRMLLCEGMWFAHVSGFPQETSLCPLFGRELQESPAGFRGFKSVQAMVSFPGSLLSLKVCMLITSSVLTMAGG